MKTSKVIDPVIFRSKLKDMSVPFFINLVRPQAASNNKIKLSTHVALL